MLSNQFLNIHYISTIYEIKYSVIIDHIVKSKSIQNDSPENLNLFRDMVRQKVEEFPPILIEWLQTKMTWNDVKTEVKLISGEPFEVTDWNSMKINLCTSNKSKKSIPSWRTKYFE